LRLPDGSIMRIGYAGQNGREYVGIGRRLREMNVLAPGEASMEGIMRWLRTNPDAGRELMHENKSYVFFKELTGEGPLGAMGAPVTAERSLAADPRFVPLGAPVWLETRYTDTDRAMQPFRQLMVAQDTGGAIKGANRFDLFWGAGARARAIAGGLSSAGRAFVLIPNSAARRIVQNVAATN
jgi:membrane-bound lytic murein transglycosylase A